MHYHHICRFVSRLFCFWLFLWTRNVNPISEAQREFLSIISSPAGGHCEDKTASSSPLFRMKPVSPVSELRLRTQRMFQFGYDNYMRHAYPRDELDPVHCTGRGHDFAHPSNININDVLGEWQLTLVDSLDSLAVMRNASEFRRAVRRVISTVRFDRDVTVQVFEASIRVLGALLSAHQLIVDPAKPFGELTPPGYSGQLLFLARDLADRLLVAFNNTATGIPHPRVNLRTGLANVSAEYLLPNRTCLAGAGSLLIEFAVLSRLLLQQNQGGRDGTQGGGGGEAPDVEAASKYERAARHAVTALWQRRFKVTGLFGDVINIQTGEWVGGGNSDEGGGMAGLGAGHDSFFEYLLKASVLFGPEHYSLAYFRAAMHSVRTHLRRTVVVASSSPPAYSPPSPASPPPRSTPAVTSACGDHPVLYVNTHAASGRLHNEWVDSLQAVWPAIFALHGEVGEAVCTHLLHYALWRRFGVSPERFNWRRRTPELRFYPLRPELAESTYALYRATRHPFYLRVGEEMLHSLQTYTRVKCGFATVHDVNDKSVLEDRMESFFLSETLKYLYLLFDEDNPANQHAINYMFTTEGHLIHIPLVRGASANQKPLHSPFFSDSSERPITEQREETEQENQQEEEEEKQKLNMPGERANKIVVLPATHQKEGEAEGRSRLLADQLGGLDLISKLVAKLASTSAASLTSTEVPANQNAANQNDVCASHTHESPPISSPAVAPSFLSQPDTHTHTPAAIPFFNSSALSFNRNSADQCESPSKWYRFRPPLSWRHMKNVFKLAGIL